MKIKYTHPGWLNLMRLVTDKKIPRSEIQESGRIRYINPGDFIDTAVSKFATCHQLVRDGNEIVMRNTADKKMVTIPILKSWTKSSLEEDKSLIDIDIGLTRANLKILEVLIANDAAPTLELLLATAISFCCQVMSYQSRGYSLMYKKSGNFLPIK